jgi:hypothetical protein
MPAKGSAPATSEAIIFSRIWEAERGQMSSVLARHILKLRFTDTDRTRMHELAAKNQDGRLNHSELTELDSYVRVADLLAILQSKARQRLRKNRSK